MMLRRLAAVLGLLAVIVALVVGVAVAHRADDAPATTTILAGHAPSGALVDGRTGRAFIFTNASSSNGDVWVSRPLVAGSSATKHVYISVVPPGGASSSPDGGTVYMLAPGSSTPQRLTGGHFSPALALVDGPANRLVLAGDSLAIVDTASAHGIGTLPLSATPVAVVAGTRPGRVFVATSDETVDVVDDQGGTLIRAVSTRPPPLAAAIPIAGTTLAAVPDRPRGHILVLDYSTEYTAGSVIVLDARDGHVLRTVTVGQAPRALAVDEARAHAFVIGSAGIDMLDTRRLALLRTSQLVPPILPGSFDPHRAVTTLVDERTGRLFAAADNGTVYVVDTVSGRLVNTVQLVTPGRFQFDMTAPPLLADDRTGRVIVPGYDGVTLMDARSGAVTGSFSTAGTANPLLAGIDEPSRLGVAVDPRTGRLLVTSQGPSHDAATKGRVGYMQMQVFDGPGAVSVLDGRNGALIRALPVGLTPGAIAVDGPSGRALVLDNGGAVTASDPWAWLPGWLRGRLPFLPRPNPPPRVVPPGVDIVDLPR